MSDAEYNNMTPRQMEFAVFCVMCVAEELQKPATEIYDLMMQKPGSARLYRRVL